MTENEHINDNKKNNIIFIKEDTHFYHLYCSVTEKQDLILIKTMMYFVEDKHKEKVALATDVRIPTSPIITSQNVPKPLNDKDDTNKNMLQDDLENNKLITLEMYEDREKLNSFIHQNIIPKLFAHTANYFKDYKVFFDDRADSYFYHSDEDSQWGFQLMLTRQFGMPYRHREVFWWSQVEAIITDLYRTYLNQLVKSKKRTTWDIEKYKEYFLYKFYGYSHIKFYNLYSKYANNRKFISYFKLIYSLIPNESVIK